MLNQDILLLKESVNKQKLILQQLRSESISYESRRDSFQKEIKQLFSQTNEEFSTLTENKLSIVDEINVRSKELEDLINQVADLRAQLRELKNETAKVETQKEEYSAKISELIAMEKNLRFKIAEHERKPESDNQHNS